MRLLVVSQYFWPENFRVNDLVAELVQRGHDVTVLTGLPNYPDGEVLPAYRADPGQYAQYAGARVVRVPLVARGKRSIGLVLNYLSFALAGMVLGPWRLRGQPFDAIFAFQPSPVMSALPAVVMGWFKRAPVALWVLDLWPDTLAAVGVVKSPRVLAAVGRLVSWIYRRCDLVLAQSIAFIPNIEAYARGGTCVRYFPGWAEGVILEGAQAVPCAPELATHAQAFKIVFAGNIGDSQDFPAILDAAEALREQAHIHWIIVGDGRAAPWVRDEIQRRGLGGSVFMMGRHPLERMPSFFEGADALLVTLRKEPIFSMTIPGKVQTYLAAGRPVLGMMDGEGARVIDASGAGWAAPAGDDKALAALVLRLSGLPSSERQAMGARARSYCAAEFDRTTLISRLEQWLLAARRSG